MVSGCPQEKNQQVVSWETPRKTVLALIPLGFVVISNSPTQWRQEQVMLSHFQSRGPSTECAIGLLSQSSEIEVHERRVHVQCTEASKDQKRQI